jgi:hypothetical protein
MPETAGRSLEGMDKLFAVPLHQVHKYAYPTDEDLKPEMRSCASSTCVMEPASLSSKLAADCLLSERISGLRSSSVGTPSLLVAGNRYGAFIFFAGICVISLVFVGFCMPETAGRRHHERDAVRTDASREDLRREEVRHRKPTCR